jgi:N-acetylmuramoyl-L-alanine amidase
MLTRRRALITLSAAFSACVLAPAALHAAGDDARQLASRGHDLLTAGKPGEAMAALREAARLDPGNAWVFNLLGRSQYETGQPAQAAESFRSALRLDANDGYARMMLDILSQRPIPARPGERKAGRHAKPSKLEEEARAELEAFSKAGHGQGRLIVLDPGHGGPDKGVTGPSGLTEKQAVLELARDAAKALAALGVTCVLTREDDHGMPLWARSAMAAMYGADLFVSLHAGAALPGHEGVETYAYAPEAADAQARAVAELENGAARFERAAPPAAAGRAQFDVTAAVMARLRDARSMEAARMAVMAAPEDAALGKARASSAPFRVLEASARPAILIEMGFLSNAQAEKALADPARRGRLAAWLAEALTKALG